MLSLTNQLTDEQMSILYHAPEGSDYAIQNKEPNAKRWNTISYALSKSEAKESFSGFKDYANPGYEYRVVRLSRYPPNAAVEVISYFKGG
jgi:hypothetical protein